MMRSGPGAASLLVLPAAAFGIVAGLVALGRPDPIALLGAVAVGGAGLVGLSPSLRTVRTVALPAVVAALGVVLFVLGSPPYDAQTAGLIAGTVIGAPAAMAGAATAYRREPAAFLGLTGALLALDAIAPGLRGAGDGAIGFAAALHRLGAAQAAGLGRLFLHGTAPGELPLAGAGSAEYIAVGLLALLAVLWSLFEHERPGSPASGAVPAEGARPFWPRWAPSAGAALAVGSTLAIAELPVAAFAVATSAMGIGLCAVLLAALLAPGRARRA